MYRGSRARGARSRGKFTKSPRGTNLPRRLNRSESPPYRSRRLRLRSRSPAEQDSLRNNRRDRRLSREDERQLTRRRPISPTRSRERSRSPKGFTSRGRREHGDRSREAILEGNKQHEQEYRFEDRIKEIRGHHSPSRNDRLLQNDKYHWTKEDQDQGEFTHEEHVDDIHDLREIIKRSRDEIRSPHNMDLDGESREADEYFKEFVPKIQDDGNNTHWSRGEERRQRHNEIITFKKSIQNDVAHEGQFVSSKDSHPDIPFFDGNDQEITPRQFVKKIEDLGYANGWRSSELKCQMAAKLQGSAREWFLKDELMNEPWEKVKTQFIKMHPTDMDFYQQLTKMMDRTKFENESYSNYFTFKTMLMSAVGITGRKAVSCLIGGLLNHELEQQCYQKNFATPEMLFEYLNSKKERKDKSLEDTTRKPHVQNPSNHHQMASPHKKPLLKTPKEPPTMNNIPKEEVHVQDYLNEPFIITKPEYETKHLLTLKIRNHLLDAYNDMLAQCVTIKEESAKHIHLEYNRRRTTIIGFRGVPVMALGDCEIRIGIDQASVNCRVYIVPNICQEKPIVVGKTMREHPQVAYHESVICVVFKQRPAYPNTFSTNEKRKEKSNHIK